MPRTKPNPPTGIPALLVAHRDGRNIAAVCRDCGMTPKALNDIEAGRSTPGLSVFAALVRRYGLSAHQVCELLDAVPARGAK